MFEQRTQSQGFKDICDSLQVFHSDMNDMYNFVACNEEEEITALDFYDLDLSEIAKLKALTSLSIELFNDDEPLDISPLSALTSLQELYVDDS